ncbi:hypothetical protein Glove_476g92 [Diversispora epigaea]|uniref:Uncharacterized protein n=1 Tax=Diversispora epigaea TaxID=1348612 RepID=A0A397GM63_9GLOM|nr:hypothetical protein Glove_476g92 [Diversispora epigaea]
MYMILYLQEGDIANEICNKYMKCRKRNCKHHVIPSSSILHKRITFTCLQYIAIRQLDTIYHHRLLIEEKSKLVLGISYEVWLDKKFDPCNSELMLKRIFVLLQLRCSSAARPGYFDFCLPEVIWLAIMLQAEINKYNKIDYNNEITYLFFQVKKLLEEIIDRNIQFELVDGSEQKFAPIFVDDRDDDDDDSDDDCDDAGADDCDDDRDDDYDDEPIEAQDTALPWFCEIHNSKKHHLKSKTWMLLHVRT